MAGLKEIPLPSDEKLITSVLVPSFLHALQFQNDLPRHYFEKWKPWLLCYLAAWNLSDGTDLQGLDPAAPLTCVPFRYAHSNWQEEKFSQREMIEWSIVLGPNSWISWTNSFKRILKKDESCMTGNAVFIFECIYQRSGNECCRFWALVQVGTDWQT